MSKSNKKVVTEGIRGAKEGVAECYDDMGGQTMTQGQETMSVTISMPGKNISVTSDSVDEIANILKLAGINVGGTSAEESPAIAVEIPGMGAEAPEAELPAMGAQTMGQQPEIEMEPEQEEPEVEEATKTPSSWEDSQGQKHPATKVQGKSYGNQDREEDSEEEEDEIKESDDDMSAYDFPEGGRYGYREGGGQSSYGSHGQFNSNGLTVIDKQTGKTVYHEDFTYFDEEPTQEELEYWFNEPVTGEENNEVEESIRALQKLAGIQEAKDGPHGKPAWLIAKEKEAEAKEDGKEAEEEVEESTDESPAPASTSIYGQGVYEAEEEMDESARILALAGITEWANSPLGKEADKGEVEGKLPSNVGQGGGNSQFGQNRANGQGENPMSPSNIANDRAIDVEEAFEVAMGEYRKFVSESIAAKK